MQRSIEEPDDLELHAYIDGELTPEEAAAVEDRLAREPEAAASVQAWLDQKQLIAEAARALAPGAASLRTAALERQLAERLRRNRRVVLPYWMRQAAAAVILVGAGWVAHGQYASWDQPMPGYVAEAVGAHRVFSGDPIRPVEFTAESSDAVIEWAAAQLGEGFDIPALEPLGLKLVGSRLLGTAEGPLAYFIYEDAAGHRLSVIVAAHPPEEPDYQFTLTSLSGTTVGYWSVDRLDYAVVAETSGAQIEAIAAEIAGTWPAS